MSGVTGLEGKGEGGQEDALRTMTGTSSGLLSKTGSRVSNTWNTPREDGSRDVSRTKGGMPTFSQNLAPSTRCVQVRKWKI